MIRKTVFAFVIVMLLSGSSWPYTGTGTSSDPFIINSYSDFRTLMQSDYATSGSYFKLSCDIQLSGYSNWEPKGTTSAPFTGHFDGQGHIIYINIQPLPLTFGNYIDLAEDRSLFGVLGTGGEIQNLDVEGTVRGYNAGGLVSIMQGGTIKNCAFSGDVIVETSPEGDDAMTYLIDELGDDNIIDANGVEILDDVTTKTRVYGKINAGGLAAVMLGGNIEDSTFRGNVTATADATPACAGGIAGRMMTDDNESISGCHVEGDAVIAASTSANGYNVLAAAGGIVGYANTQLNSSIEGCTFDGTVNSTYYAGGIAGDVNGTILSGDTVSSTAKITGTYSAGGIAGYMAAGAWAKNNTVESGTVITAEVYSSGGIIGILETSGRTGSNKPLEDNTSAATLSGEVYKGGIVGALGNNTYSGAVIGEGNTYSGTEYGIGRDEWGQPSDGHESFSITTRVLTNAVAGKYYTAFLSLDRTPSADLRVTWTFSGTLPEGLTSSDSGIISGTPAKPETRTFTAGAFITGYGPTPSADITITVNSSDAPASTTTSSINITTASLPDGMEGTAYSYTLAAALTASSDSSVVWSVADGNLPVGLSLDRQGVISGTPYEAGTYTFTVQAESGQLKGSKIFTLTINSAFWIMTDSALPTAKAGRLYSVTLSADTDAANRVNWELLNGSLPSGLSLNPETGNISGTPTRAGNYTFTVRAVSGYSAAQKQFTLKVELVITSEPYLANGTAGEMYTHVFTAEGASAGAILWTVSSDSVLPAGLTLSTNGILSGITNEAGTYTFMVYAFVGNDVSAKQTVRLTIDPDPASAVPILTAGLPDGQVSQDYYAELRAGIEGVVWQVESGEIPEGLTLREDGLISGVPVKAGVYSFIVGASDSNRYSTRQFTITINAPEPEPKYVSSSGGGGCDSGIGIIGLAVLGLMFCRRKL